MIGVGTIREWAIMLDHGKPYVSGLVFDHPTFPDNTLIYTSNIVGVNGKQVVTTSGSCYELEGPPNEGLLKLFIETYGPVDPENPFKEYCKTL